MSSLGSRAANFGGLQGRFDNTSDADGHVVLKFEHIFERSVEAVGPKMSASEGVD